MALPGRVSGIQWGVFFRTASPLAALTGFLGFLFSPLTVLFVLPLSLRRTIHRYRPYHAGKLSSGQGARLGAFMALLSFVAFLIFFLATISLKREALLKMFQEQAGQYHDPQSQQVLAWLASNQGFAIFTVGALFFALLVFLGIGAISGALMAAPPKKRA